MRGSPAGPPRNIGSASSDAEEAAFTNERVRGFQTLLIQGKSTLQVRIEDEYLTMARTSNIPAIQNWLRDGISQRSEQLFYMDVEKLWRAFVDYGVKIGPYKFSFNVLIEQKNTARGTPLPQDRPDVAGKEFGVLYYNSRESISTQGTIYTNEMTGKGPLATRVYLSFARPEITLLKNTLYRIS